MKLNSTIWITDDWGITKFKSGYDHVVFGIVFTKEMQAMSGPHWYSKLQAKKDIWRMLNA